MTPDTMFPLPGFGHSSHINGAAHTHLRNAGRGYVTQRPEGIPPWTVQRIVFGTWDHFVNEFHHSLQNLGRVVVFLYGPVDTVLEIVIKMQSV